MKNLFQSASLLGGVLAKFIYQSDNFGDKFDAIPDKEFKATIGGRRARTAAKVETLGSLDDLNNKASERKNAMNNDKLSGREQRQAKKEWKTLLKAIEIKSENPTPSQEDKAKEAQKKEELANKKATKPELDVLEADIAETNQAAQKMAKSADTAKQNAKSSKIAAEIIRKAGTLLNETFTVKKGDYLGTLAFGLDRAATAKYKVDNGITGRLTKEQNKLKDLNINWATLVEFNDARGTVPLNQANKINSGEVVSFKKNAKGETVIVVGEAKEVIAQLTKVTVDFDGTTKDYFANTANDKLFTDNTGATEIAYKETVGGKNYTVEKVGGVWEAKEVIAQLTKVTVDFDGTTKDYFANTANDKLFTDNTGATEIAYKETVGGKNYTVEKVGGVWEAKEVIAQLTKVTVDFDGTTKDYFANTANDKLFTDNTGATEIAYKETVGGKNYTVEKVGGVWEAKEVTTNPSNKIETMESTEIQKIYSSLNGVVFNKATRKVVLNASGESWTSTDGKQTISPDSYLHIDTTPAHGGISANLSFSKNGKDIFELTKSNKYVKSTQFQLNGGKLELIK